MKKLELIQNDKWPYSYTITDAVISNGESVGSLKIEVMLARLHSNDTLEEANARPENIVLSKYLKLFTAAPEMLELLKSTNTAMSLDYDNFDDTDGRLVYDHIKDINALVSKIDGDE